MAYQGGGVGMDEGGEAPSGLNRILSDAPALKLTSLAFDQISKFPNVFLEDAKKFSPYHDEDVDEDVMLGAKDMGVPTVVDVKNDDLNIAD